MSLILQGFSLLCFLRFSTGEHTWVQPWYDLNNIFLSFQGTIFRVFFIVDTSAPMA
jgi:hypothetical protein